MSLGFETKMVESISELSLQIKQNQMKTQKEIDMLKTEIKQLQDTEANLISNEDDIMNDIDAHNIKIHKLNEDFTRFKKYSEEVIDAFKKIDNRLIKLEGKTTNESLPLILSIKIGEDDSLIFYIKNLICTNVENEDIGYIESLGEAHILSNENWASNFNKWLESEMQYSEGSIMWNGTEYFIENGIFSSLVEGVQTKIYDFINQVSFPTIDKNILKFSNGKIILH